MKVFMTLLVDSLRLLRARRLFWVTLAISIVVALAYLSVGFTSDGWYLGFGMLTAKDEVIRAGSPGAQSMYLDIFGKLVGFWLSWAAVILALISCAPIFPDFMTEGAIGIPMSKPVSRGTLFFYKYVGCLLFVLLQVLAFCVIVFVAVRWRIGIWNPGVFWAVPLVTLMFSYIYSVVVVVAVKTRSVLPGLLAGFFFWALVFFMQFTNDGLYMMAKGSDVLGAPRLEPGQTDIQWEKWHRVTEGVMMALPKTGETTRLMNRLIKVKTAREGAQDDLISATTSGYGELGQLSKSVATRHSAFYIIGTSLAFEAVMLGLAAWIFCRRDY
ncbi:hypothetical protein [Luteolibacter sp. LG18]|uniref:hypothetical protein n=1 Tax=Luteolibacter sp. LG18 TaxID=2819286 RepID=UPI002B2EB659|nr:hypothetical protein llg_06430 [Luteolibacter sp. LG18]